MMNYFLYDQNVLTHTCFDDGACSQETDMIGMGTQRTVASALQKLPGNELALAGHILSVC